MLDIRDFPSEVGSEFGDKFHDGVLTYPRDFHDVSAPQVKGIPFNVHADRLPANLGYIYENLAAQMLRSAGNNLYYYTWPKDDRHNYEVDFLLSRGTKLCPLEIKSGSYNSHASLDEFCKKFSSRVGNRYLIYTNDLRNDGEALLVPKYMTGLL